VGRDANTKDVHMGSEIDSDGVARSAPTTRQQGAFLGTSRMLRWGYY